MLKTILACVQNPEISNFKFAVSRTTREFVASCTKWSKLNPERWAWNPNVDEVDQEG